MDSNSNSDAQQHHQNILNQEDQQMQYQAPEQDSIHFHPETQMQPLGYKSVSDCAPQVMSKDQSFANQLIASNENHNQTQNQFQPNNLIISNQQVPHSSQAESSIIQAHQKKPQQHDIQAAALLHTYESVSQRSSLEDPHSQMLETNQQKSHIMKISLLEENKNDDQSSQEQHLEMNSKLVISQVQFLVKGSKTQKIATSTTISIHKDKLHEVFCLIENLNLSLNKFNNLIYENVKMDKEDSLKSCLYFDQAKLLEPKKFFSLMDHSMELIYRAFKNLIISEIITPCLEKIDGTDLESVLKTLIRSPGAKYIENISINLFSEIQRFDFFLKRIQIHLLVFPNDLVDDEILEGFLLFKMYFFFFQGCHTYKDGIGYGQQGVSFTNMPLSQFMDTFYSFIEKAYSEVYSESAGYEGDYDNFLSSLEDKKQTFSQSRVQSLTIPSQESSELLIQEGQNADQGNPQKKQIEKQ